MKQGSDFVSIVIPVHNEGEILAESLKRIGEAVDTTGLGYELIAVDDGSTDNTWEVLSKLSLEQVALKGLRLTRNFGKEPAISAGLACARGSAVVVMDGDLQHPPELIPEMIRLWREGSCDVVEAVKADRGEEPISARLRAKLFYWLMKRFTDLELTGSSDFKLLDRKVVNTYNGLPERSRFFRGIVSWLGFRRMQIPFSVKERSAGESRWTVRQLIGLAVHASTAFTSLPLHLITVLGVITFLMSVIIGIHTLYMKFTGEAVSGFTTVILLLLFVGSALMISLGIIGIYISRIFEEVKGRPQFVIGDTLNIESR